VDTVRTPGPGTGALTVQYHHCTIVRHQEPLLRCLDTRECALCPPFARSSALAPVNCQNVSLQYEHQVPHCHDLAGQVPWARTRSTNSATRTAEIDLQVRKRGLAEPAKGLRSTHRDPVKLHETASSRARKCRRAVQAARKYFHYVICVSAEYLEVSRRNNRSVTTRRCGPRGSTTRDSRFPTFWCRYPLSKAQGYCSSALLASLCVLSKPPCLWNDQKRPNSHVGA